MDVKPYDAGAGHGPYLSMDTCISLLRRQRIEITYCECFDETSDIWCFDLHNHPAEIEMIYFRAGDASIEISSEKISVSPYDVVIYPEGAFHKESLAPFAKQEIVCIRVHVEGGLLFEHPIHIADQDHLLGMLFRKTYETFYNRNREENLSEDYIRILLLACVAAHMDARTSGDFLDVVREYLTDHYTEKISVPDLARMVHVSDAYLNKCFKKRNGLSIIKYVNVLRMEAAMHMLIATDFPIERIAATAGFNSPKYFCRVFKAYTNRTPSDFRREKNKRYMNRGPTEP